MAYNPKPVVEPQRVVIDSRLLLHHPEYNPAEMAASLPADLALIKLPFPIEFNVTKLTSVKSINSLLKIIQYFLMLQISLAQLNVPVLIIELATILPIIT